MANPASVRLSSALTSDSVHNDMHNK
jgi:hypothetical protein